MCTISKRSSLACLSDIMFLFTLNVASVKFDLLSKISRTVISSLPHDNQ